VPGLARRVDAGVSVRRRAVAARRLVEPE